MATQDSDNPDLRDRGFIYWRLLSTDPAAAKEVRLTVGLKACPFLRFRQGHRSFAGGRAYGRAPAALNGIVAGGAGGETFDRGRDGPD